VSQWPRPGPFFETAEAYGTDNNQGLPAQIKGGDWMIEGHLWIDNVGLSARQSAQWVSRFTMRKAPDSDAPIPFLVMRLTPNPNQYSCTFIVVNALYLNFIP
jgi:hypothetical protein